MSQQQEEEQTINFFDLVSDTTSVEKEKKQLIFDNDIDENVVIDFVSSAIQTCLEEMGYIVYNECLFTLEKINNLQRYNRSCKVLSGPLENKKEKAKIKLENELNASIIYHGYPSQSQPNFITYRSYTIPYDTIKAEKTTEINSEVFIFPNNTFNFAHSKYLTSLKSSIKRIGIGFPMVKKETIEETNFDFNKNIMGVVLAFVKNLEDNYKGHYRVNYSINLKKTKITHFNNTEVTNFRFEMHHCGFVVYLC
jgi:hypothetical protein